MSYSKRKFDEHYSMLENDSIKFKKLSKRVITEIERLESLIDTNKINLDFNLHDEIRILKECIKM